MAKSEIDIRFLTFRLTERGRDAIAAAKWPLAVGLIVIALAIVATSLWRVI